MTRQPEPGLVTADQLGFLVSARWSEQDGAAFPRGRRRSARTANQGAGGRERRGSGAARGSEGELRAGLATATHVLMEGVQYSIRRTDSFEYLKSKVLILFLLLYNCTG